MKPEIDQHFAWIRAYAKLISLENWRDMQDNIAHQFAAIERLPQTKKAAPSREGQSG